MKRIERRTFMKSATAISAFTVLKPGIAFGSKNNSAIRMGFIGCGNRGTGVITTMSANTNINVIALADIFDDKLIHAQKTLNNCNAKKGFADIQKTNIYQGSNAYLKVLDNKNVDAVLISTPAYAHPGILEAAVAAGKHAYSEKPVAIDIDGCKRILKVSETINNKLSVVIDFSSEKIDPKLDLTQFDK